MAGDRMVLLLALLRETQPVPLQSCLAEPCKPCRASPALLPLPPPPTLLQPAFFLRGFGTKAESQASPVLSPLPLQGPAETLSAGPRGPPQPQLLPRSPSCLSLSPISSALTKAAIWPVFLLFFILLSGSKKKILTRFPRPWDFSQPHTVHPCRGSLGSCGVPAPHSQKTGRWESSSAPLLSKQIPPGSTT